MHTMHNLVEIMSIAFLGEPEIWKTEKCLGIF